MRAARYHFLPIAMLVICLTVFHIVWGSQESGNGSETAGSITTAEPVDSEVIQRFDIAKCGEPILLPVSWNGTDYQFLLETGSEITTFDTTLRPGLESLGKQTSLRAFSSVVRTEMFKTPDASVGELKLETDAGVTCTDLTALRRVSGQEIYGCLGMDFLKRYVIQVDSDRGTLSFLRGVDASNPGFGKSIQILYKSRTPYVAAAASEEYVDFFVVDTGATTTVTISPEAFQSLATSGRIKRLRAGRAQTVASTDRPLLGRMQLLAVKNFAVPEPIVRTASEQVLGLGLWSRFVVTFDFPNRVIYLREGSRFNEPDRVDLSGLHILRIEGATVVHSVDENSPAAEAGIQANDQISQIGEDAAENLSPFAIREILTEEHEKLHLTLCRGSRRFDCSLRLQQPE